MCAKAQAQPSDTPSEQFGRSVQLMQRALTCACIRSHGAEHRMRGEATGSQGGTGLICVNKFERARPGRAQACDCRSRVSTSPTVARKASRARLLARSAPAFRTPAYNPPCVWGSTAHGLSRGRARSRPGIHSQKSTRMSLPSARLSCYPTSARPPSGQRVGTAASCPECTSKPIQARRGRMSHPKSYRKARRSGSSACIRPFESST